jgi:hypothetical protein
MLDNTPKTLTNQEWKEIVDLPAVREAWGLDDDQDVLEFASTVYAAKFNYISAGPGYVGDLYVLQGDALTEVSPMVLRRDKDGHLIVC